jgi:beta-lactamase regulating signal transducer with metallopeptidase domain
MIALESFFQTPAFQAAGWALLQFLWQGALVGLGTAAALALLRSRAASTRYLVACAAMLLMLILPVVTALRAYDDRPLPSPRAALSAAALEGTVTGAGAQPFPAALADVSKEGAQFLFSLRQLREVAQPFLPQIAMAWFLGVLLLSVRLVGSWTQVRRIEREGTSPAPAHWRAAMSDLMQRMQMRQPVRLLSSTLSQVPAALGWLRPVILIPVSALSNLSVQQVESILAHELAHIRRRDYLINLLQSAVEILLFYHPAVWWVSSRMRIERENCCDDIAVEICGDVQTYARALVALEDLRQAPALAVAANGGSLLFRIRRLLQPSAVQPADRPAAGVMLVVLAFLLTSSAALTAQTQTGTETPPAAAAPAPAAAPARFTPEQIGQMIREVTPPVIQEAERAAATCGDRDTLRRCADVSGKVQLECYPNNRLFRFWLGLVGREDPLEEEGQPAVITQNQIAELVREKMGVDPGRPDFPECRRERSR